MQSSISTEPPNRPKQKKPVDSRGKQRANSKGLIQAYELRDTASEHASALRDAPTESLEDQATRAQALRNLASVWCVASDRIRILRGKPLPGSLRPQSKPTKKKQISSAPSEQPSSPDAK